MSVTRDQDLPLQGQPPQVQPSQDHRSQDLLPQDLQAQADQVQDGKVESPQIRDLAVVIVNHNTAKLLIECLDSLRDGGLEKLDAQVWVVDNASTDESCAEVRRFHPQVSLIESRENIGFSAANNLALRAAGFRDLIASEPATEPAHPSGKNAADVQQSTPFTPSNQRAQRFRHALILNPDTLVPPGACAQMIEDLEAEDSIGALGPKLVLPDGSLDLACRRSFPTPEVSFYRFSGLSKRFPKHPRFGRYNMTFLDEDQPADVDSVVGACMLVRGEVLDAVGLLDERFWMYGEDIDWALRIQEAGWRVVYRPRTVIQHVKRAASSGSKRANFEFQRAMWLFFDKHYAARTALPIRALVMLALGMRGGRRLVAEMRNGNASSA